MNEDNDLLLRQFFTEATAPEVADRGFTERVMRRLPARPNWLLRLWTLFCVAVFAALFVALRGWELLAVHLEVLLRTLVVEPVSVNLLMPPLVAAGVLLVVLSELLSARHRWL